MTNSYTDDINENFAAAKAEIEGIKETYTPLETITEINTALNGKASTTHTHSKTDITDFPTIPAAVTETTVTNWGFTKNAGTVKKVNNTSPDSNGNVSISIPTVNNGKTIFKKDGTAIATITANQTGTVNVDYTIPSAITETTVSGWGFTKNVGTITGIKMNGSSKGTSGVVNLGTVITAHQDISGKENTSNKVTSLSSSSTNTQYPSAKCVYDALQNAGGGATRNIGEIVTSTIPLTDAGLHLLDGALIQGSGIYSAFVTYIAGLVSTYPDLFTTEANWQSAVTQYGVCGKFVYNSTNNTVRLPKYSNKIFTGEGTAPVIGNGISLGLTNGTSNYGLCNAVGNAGNLLSSNSSSYGTSLPSSGSSGTYAANTARLGVTTDSTKSGLIAQLSDITTSLDGYYYIVVATSTKTDIQVDIDEIATDLNGKADIDLSNVPTSKGILTESYKNGTSWYRVYSDGWCEQGGEFSNIAINSWTQISLLKEYATTSYTILFGGFDPSDFTFPDTIYTYRTKTNSSFYAGLRAFNSSTVLPSRGANWYACGYIR